MHDDAGLLEAWATGDTAAAQELAARYYSRVLRFFDLRVGPAAEDLTQRTFLACIESRRRLRSASSFRAFLFGVARNVLLMHLRRRGTEDELFETGDASGGSDRGPTVSRVVARHEEQALLLRALQTLDPGVQIVLQLFYWEELRGPEIAEALGVAPSTVTTRLSRARQALREAVARLPAVQGPRTSLLSAFDAWLESMRALSVELDDPRPRG